MRSEVRDTVRGLSIHTSVNGLLYYIHFEQEGTVEVQEKEYYQALFVLDQ
jgi:hypothetical protein